MKPATPKAPKPVAVAGDTRADGLDALRTALESVPMAALPERARRHALRLLLALETL